MNVVDSKADLRRVTFNVASEPWLPVRDMGNSVRQASLRGALVGAHEIAAISDPTPTIEFGLYRLLLALLMDVYRLDDQRALRQIISAGRFDTNLIDCYFAENEGLFDLFDPDHPFLQTAHMDGAQAKPLAGLFPPIPSGTNAMHFHREHEEDFGVGPAAAARLLTSIAPFMTAGGAGLAPSINGAPPWYVLVTGRTLFETLTRNMYVMGDRGRLGIPAWQRKAGITADRRTTFTFLEALTWQPRRIQLITGEGGTCAMTGETCEVLVRTMRFEAGWSCNFENWTDPNVAYKTVDGKRTPLRPQEGRQVWRDTAPLALLEEKDHTSGQIGRIAVRFSRPRIIDQFVRLLETRVLSSDEPVRLSLYGERTDLRMKVFEWFSERLVVPLELVWKGVHTAEVQEQMRLAGEVAYALRRAVLTVLKEGVMTGTAGEAEQCYWIDLRPEFEGLLQRLALIDTEDENAYSRVAEAGEPWKRSIRQIALHHFRQAVDIISGAISGRYLAAATRAEIKLSQNIAKVLWPFTAGTSKTNGGREAK